MTKTLRWSLLGGLSVAAGLVVSLFVSHPAPPPADPPAPVRLPRFELPDLEGQLHSVTEWQGKVLVLNFWATWCAPCRREMPLLDALNRESSATLRVVGVAVDHAEPVQSFIAESGVRYLILVGQDEAMQIAEGIAPDFEGLPLSVVVGPVGEILQVHVGELHPQQIREIATVATALASGELSSEEARKRLKQRLRST